MKENKNVIKNGDDKSVIYCAEEYAQDLYYKYIGHDPSSKDVKDGEVLRIVDFVIHGKDQIEAICENQMSLFFVFEKEKKYFDLIGLNNESFNEWVSSKNHIEYLKDTKMFISVDSARDCRGSLYSAHLVTIVKDFKEQIANPKTAYMAKVISKNQGGFIVDVQGISAFLPGSLAAANKITNFESFIGRKLYVMIEDFLQPSNIFVVSYKKYLDNILPSKLAELERNQRMKGTVTGTSKFGVFAEFGEIFTGLLHSTEMSPETLEKFNANKFRSGESIEAWLKDIRDNKLILTEIDPSIRQNEIDQLIDDVEGSMQDAVIVSIKPHGALMEIEEGVLGLLPIKEMKKTGRRLNIGETLSVFVKKVDSSSGKIYLTLEETAVEKEK